MIYVNNQIDSVLWNKLINNSLFFKYEWLYVIQNIYKLEPNFILYVEDDKFALIGSFKTNKGYISLPYLSYSGFCTNDANTLKSLKNYLKENNIDIDSRDLLTEEVSEGYVNPIVTIKTFDSFWKSISTNTRNQFKKSEKNSFSFIEDKNIDNFYQLYSLGMRNLGTPTHGIKYFNEIIKYFLVHIFTVYDGVKPIGSMFCINDEDTLAVLYAYVLPEYSKKYANYFLYLNAIKWMTTNELVYLDMGRSTFGEGTFHFKKKFRPKFYGINSKINYSSNNKLKAMSEVWSKLPISIVNFIGPKIRKYLP